MDRLNKIKERFEDFKNGQATAPLPPDDCVWLIELAEAAYSQWDNCNCDCDPCCEMDKYFG